MPTSNHLGISFNLVKMGYPKKGWNVAILKTILFYKKFDRSITSNKKFPLYS